MSKLSHSNPYGNKHLALGGKNKLGYQWSIPSNTSKPNKINLSPKGDAAQDTFDQSFDAWCDGEDDDGY